MIKLDLADPDVWEEKARAEASPREVTQAILKVLEIATAIESRKKEKAHSSKAWRQNAPPRLARNRDQVAALFGALYNNEDPSYIPFELAAIGPELCNSEEPPVPDEEG
ncbi:hypothetical protein CYMTET_39075 [Cymbomonas tetramitiformis]|uniref:Uncharacterized protein n=1 Tax=Cymbomonas tetramitiformis TaxID=36881 RepID=A0AAE0CD01_9CHLO|nr:hypothetical protein CYMTET_39075 [Cymbomonas tetramitiformis]